MPEPKDLISEEEDKDIDEEIKELMYGHELEPGVVGTDGADESIEPEDKAAGDEEDEAAAGKEEGGN